MGTFARSWSLTKASWQVLREDKELAVLPAISSVASLILATPFFAIAALTASTNSSGAGTASTSTSSSTSLGIGEFQRSVHGPGMIAGAVDHHRPLELTVSRLRSRQRSNDDSLARAADRYPHPFLSFTRRGKMKALRLAAGFALVLVLAGCGEDAAPATVMPDVVDQQLDVALSDVKRAGFEGEVEVLGGGTFGVVDESNWKVCEQLPAAGREVTDAPRLTVDRSCGDDAAEPTTASTTTAPARTEPPTTALAPTEPPTTEVAEILTVDNSPDLAALLTEPDYCNDTVESFAATYAGRTIEFDGNIANYAPEMQPDMLVYSGDYSETSSNGGPAFKFTPPNIPGNVGQGNNVHIVAQVGDFNRVQCLLFLTPVSTDLR